MFLIFVFMFVWGATSTVMYISESKKNKFADKITNEKVNDVKTRFEIYKKVSMCEVERLNKVIFKELERNKELHMEIQKVIANQRILIPEGTLEAVKYAMNKSHPDNGGKTEDFIKFRKIYENLKGMN